MRITLLSALSVSALGISLAAQVPPAIKDVDTSVTPWEPPYEASLDPTTYLDPLNQPLGANTNAAQWEFRTPTGSVYPMVVTLDTVNVTATSTLGLGVGFLGGIGGIASGTWNRNTGVVNLNNHCASMNASIAPPFAGTMDWARLRLASDLGDPLGAGYATRANVNVPFGPTSTIIGTTNWPANGYGDSKIIQVGANTHFAWINAANNNLVSGALTGNTITGVIATRVVSLPGTLGMHSPEDVRNNNQVLGWICSAQIVAGQSDPFFVPDVNNDINAAQKIFADPNAGWYNNPGSVGNSGTAMWAYSGAYTSPKKLALIACNGGRLIPNTVKTVRVWIPQDNNPWLTALMLGTAQLVNPINLNFTWGNNIAGPPRPPGQLGIVPIPTVPALVAAGGSGGANYGFTVTNAIPVGIPIYVQGVGVNSAVPTDKVYLGNTAIMVR